LFCFPLFFLFFSFFPQYFFWFSAAAFCSGKRLLTFCVRAVFRLLRLQKNNSSRESELRVFLSRKVRTYGSSSSSLVRFPPNFCFGARVHWQFIYNK
jgi:hypothetical protein